MPIPLDITFHGVEHSDALESKIRERAEKLELYAERIQRCRVVVETPHKHQNKGSLYDIRIDVRVPGDEFVVSRSGHKDQAHEDPYVAVRDAFEAMAHQLESKKPKRR